MTGIRLVLADVDGTLVTPDKELTARAQRAVLALRTAGIAYLAGGAIQGRPSLRVGYRSPTVTSPPARKSVAQRIAHEAWS